MTGPSRICFDVTYTRTQTGNVGITRTVRHLLESVQEVGANDAFTCVPVACHSQGFRLVTAPKDSGAGAATHLRPAARLYGRLTSGTLRRIASAVMPMFLLEAVWTLTSRWTFNRLSAHEPRMKFEPGDWLVLGDESWNYAAWRGALRARACGAKAVLVLYDLIPVRSPQFCSPLFTRAFSRWLLRMLTSCDAVMCISRATEDDLRRFCEEQQVRCPATGHFRLGSDAPPAGGGGVRDFVREFIETSAPCFAAIGTIEPRKNHKLLLTVFDRLWAAGVDVRLFIAGRPHPDSHPLIEQLRRHPQQGRRLMTVLDASDEEIDLAYSKCRALLFPSLAEGFGLPLVEARARGCTVIASNLPALMELADEGVFLYSKDCADELEALVVQHSMPEKAARFEPMRVFTWRDSAEQFLEMTCRLLDVPESSKSSLAGKLA
jgi:glycosyltransferase involved in cell wall biosynthesis